VGSTTPSSPEKSKGKRQTLEILPTADLAISFVMLAVVKAEVVLRVLQRVAITAKPPQVS